MGPMDRRSRARERISGANPGAANHKGQVRVAGKGTFLNPATEVFRGHLAPWMSRTIRYSLP